MPTALQIVQSFYPEVTKVRDSKRNLTIKVTKADAHNTGVKKHKDCALAVACKREGADGAIICVKTSYIIRGTEAIRYKNPESVAREVVSFDRKAGFEPGEYALSKVPTSNRLGTIRAWKKSGRTSKKSMNYHRTENVRILE
jgi:hypothetical protein